LESVSNGAVNFLNPEMLFFSAANGAMIAPRHWELRKQSLTDIG
jgi:hypothetical protein